MTPWGDGYGERPGGLTLDALHDELPARHRLRPDGAAASTTILRTASGDVELAHDNILGDLPRLRDRIAHAARRACVLIGRRHVRSNNSWMHNVTVLVKGKPRCTLIVHPDDAAELGLGDGERAPGHVRGRLGRGRRRGERRDPPRRGEPAPRLGPRPPGHSPVGRPRARRAPTRNLLAPGHLVDVPSGNAAVNGIPVEVVPV